MRLALIWALTSAFLVFAAAFAQAGAASAAPKAGASGHQKTLAVIADLGKTFNVRKIGGNFFDQHETQLAIPDWKVDDRIVAEVTKILGKRFKVKRVPVPPGTFARLPDPIVTSSRTFDRNYKFVVEKLAASQKADFTLAITPGYSRFEGNEMVSGLGIVQRESLLTKGETVHCLVLYRLYDASFNLVYAGGAMIRPEFSETVSGPNAPLGSSGELRRDLQNVARDPRAKDIALDLLDKDIAATVPKLFPRS
jgi:hypothetical protein